MYQLVIYIPQSHCEVVKLAMFEAGAGRYKNYEQCSWQVKGQGQFKPLEGSSPFIGNQNVLETVEEYRVEMICEKQVVKGVIKAMLAAHPYEEPAYLVLEHRAL
ncbi:MAG: NGG1p interacting factor NIF3 [Thiotrichaceae bacterium]